MQRLPIAAVFDMAVHRGHMVSLGVYFILSLQLLKGFLVAANIRMVDFA